MRRLMLPCAVAAVLGAASYAVAADPPAIVTYQAPGGTYTGVKPTAVGLPHIGVSGTVGASDFASHLRDYHDSGDYDRDLAAVGAQAKAYLQTRLDQNAAKAKRSCKTRYRKVKGRRLYRRVRTCRAVAPPRFSGKPAIVLDIDETSLSNYSAIEADDFTFGQHSQAEAVDQVGTAIAPTLKLFKDARAAGVAVFFITGRGEAVRAPTEANLRREGYDGWKGLYLKPADSTATTVEYKTAARRDIESKGYRIIANLGDQFSDLAGGHAKRAFKLPNPFYFLP
jgi:predicted secreted acid phosphatase